MIGRYMRFPNAKRGKRKQRGGNTGKRKVMKQALSKNVEWESEERTGLISCRVNAVHVINDGLSCSISRCQNCFYTIARFLSVKTIEFTELKWLLFH